MHASLHIRFDHVDLTGRGRNLQFSIYSLQKAGQRVDFPSCAERSAEPLVIFSGDLKELAFQLREIGKID